MKLFFLLPLISSIILGSCCFSKKNLGKLLLSDEEKAYVTYTGNETLIFKNQNNEDLTLVGNGRKNEFIKENTSAKESCEFYEVEFNETTFKSENTGLIFSFQIAAAQYPLGNTIPFITIKTYYLSNTMNEIYHYFPTPINSMCEKQSDFFTCNNTLLINNTEYINVYKLIYEYEIDSNSIKTIYYSKEHGLLQFETSSGVVWKLFSKQ
jgi:hypothetical protein